MVKTIFKTDGHIISLVIVVLCVVLAEDISVMLIPVDHQQVITD